VTDDEIAKLAAGGGGLTDAQIAAMASDQGQGLPNPRKFVKLGAPPQHGQQEDERGFLGRAKDSIVSGIHDVATVGRDLVSSRGRALLDPQKRRQLERGIDDVVTLGYGQRLAARVGNALGDTESGGVVNQKLRRLRGMKPGESTSLNEQRRFELDSSGHRMRGQGAGPSRVESEDQAAAPQYRTAGSVVGAAIPGIGSGIAKGAAKFVGKVIPRAAGGTVKQLLTGASRGAAGYAAAAPVTAALAADGQSPGEALNDPAGLLLATALGAGGEAIGAGVARSKGAQARRFIEQRGGKVSAGTPGKGRVFDTMEVEGTTDADIGEQARRSGERVQPQLEQYRRDVAQKPYLDELTRITPAQAGQLVDVRPIYSDLVKSYYHPGTDPQVASQIKRQLDIMDERYTRPNGDILMPQEHLNGLRKTLGGLAGAGETSDPSLAPLRSAFGTAKSLVDGGPYARANAAFAAGSADAAEGMKDVGLRRSYSATAPERDVNKLRIKAQRIGQNTVTAGSDNPGFERFRTRHPELALELERPALLRAKGDLTFGLQKEHGGLIDRNGSAMGMAATIAAAATGGHGGSIMPALAAFAYQNRTPIAGRLLYPLSGADATNVGARIGAASAAKKKADRVLDGDVR